MDRGYPNSSLLILCSVGNQRMLRGEDDRPKEPQFLLCLERTLRKKLEDIDCWIREHNINPGNELLRELIRRTQNDVKVIQDSIQRVIDERCHLKLILS